MNRRDTIIISVLINAGLLTILFATAMNVEESMDVVNARSTEISDASMDTSTPSQQVAVVDEVDQMLKMHAAEKNQIQTTPSTITYTADATTPPIDGVVPPTSKLATGPAEFDHIEGAPGKNYVEVTVKRGDYLSTIAKSNKTTVEAIMTENKLASTSLKVGQILRVPNGKTTTAAITASAPKTTSQPISTSPKEIAESDYYIVKSGDNPWLIAQKNGMKLDELLELNSLDEQKAKKLKPGDKLRIR